VAVSATLGYARVSTIGRDLHAQHTALTVAGVDRTRIFTDTLSGSAKTARPGLAAMLDYVRAGDTVIVTAIDRLGRSVAEVTHTIADLGERRITLHAYVKASTPPPLQGAPWQPSWPPSPNSSSSSDGSAAPRRVQRISPRPPFARH
jgi:hypothetical protein